MRTAAILCLMAAAEPAAAQALHLVCAGEGVANKTSVTSGHAQNSNGDFASAQIYGQRAVGFEDQVNIDINDGVGRIRMPRTMLPPIRGGKDGWFELKNLKIGENEITASAAVSILNSPKVRIDRISGMLNISGKSGDFSARCQPYDPENVKRAF